MRLVGKVKSTNEKIKKIGYLIGCCILAATLFFISVWELIKQKIKRQ
tara:strand:+ start:293 stop:433 length:141 start_codon:yes stop_codon:yes gene_type:complete